MRPVLLAGAVLGVLFLGSFQTYLGLALQSHFVVLRRTHTRSTACQQRDGRHNNNVLSLCVCLAGVCYLVGVPVIDWVLSGVQLLVYAVSALLWAFWQLLQPTQENRHSNLPELHQVRVCGRARQQQEQHSHIITDDTLTTSTTNTTNLPH